eukprot:5037321-Prymnesium_polylepis.1
MTPVVEPPDWLGAALERGGEVLHGRHIVFKWEEWGFACGKVGTTVDTDANFSVTYEGGWKEDQTLELPAYGSDDYG